MLSDLKDVVTGPISNDKEKCLHAYGCARWFQST
jgi:hypothetical protein